MTYFIRAVYWGVGIIMNENRMTNLSKAGCWKYCYVRISDHIFDFQCQCIQWLLFVRSVSRHCSVSVCACVCYLSTHLRIRLNAFASRLFFSTSSFNFISMTMIWNRIINIVICWQLFPHPPRSLLPKFVIASLSISPLNYLREFRFRFSAALHLDLMTSNSICIFASTIQHLLRFGIVRTLNEIRICLSI